MGKIGLEECGFFILIDLGKRKEGGFMNNNIAIMHEYN